MRSIGLHIRLPQTVDEVIEKASRMHLSSIQFFFITNSFRQVVIPEKDYERLRTSLNNFSSVYLHLSYWINLCGKSAHGMHIIHRELSMAQRLGITHAVLHPGSAVGFNTKEEGIATLAQRLNQISRQFENVHFVLENTTHAQMTVGSDIKDFGILFRQFEHPERFSLCIDTAHAYSYGYDVATAAGQDNFLHEIDRAVGLEAVSLLHINDTKEILGCRIDKHDLPGKGNIGQAMLQRFINIEPLKNKPIILELPPISEEKEIESLKAIWSWISS
jgi:deoxyribonuclease-4